MAILFLVSPRQSSTESTLITFLIEIESKSESNAVVHIFRIESNFYADNELHNLLFLFEKFKNVAYKHYECICK